MFLWEGNVTLHEGVLSKSFLVVNLVFQGLKLLK